MVAGQHNAAAKMQMVFRGHVAQQQYQHTQCCVWVMQASIRMHLQQSSFKQMKQSATVMQSAARGWAVCQMVAGQHNAAAKVQAVFRGHVAQQQFATCRLSAVRMQSACRASACRAAYRQAVGATIVLQSLCRMMVSMVHAQKIRSGTVLSNRLSALFYRRQYTQTRSSFIVLQSVVRCVMQKKVFTNQCSACTLLASVVRGHHARQQYFTCRSASIAIQSIARGISMRASFDRQRAQLFAEKRVLEQKLGAARAMQRVMRNWLGHRHENAAATRVQRWASPLLHKRRWRRTIRSLICVQSRVRAMYIRRRSSKAVREVRRKVAVATAAATEEMKLGNRTATALEALLGSSKLAIVMRACQTLEVSTRLSVVCCENFAHGGAVPVLYSMIRSCNRSEPHLMLLKHALSTLRHVSRQPRLVAYVSEPAEAVEVLVDLLQMFRDKETTFMLAVSVLGLVCKYKAKTIAQRDDWMCADVEKRLQSIAQLLSRKHEIEQRSSRGGAKQKSRSAVNLQRLLAALPARK
jgi:abnormal spindle-like microcephaly-associated protein